VTTFASRRRLRRGGIAFAEDGRSVGARQRIRHRVCKRRRRCRDRGPRWANGATLGSAIEVGSGRLHIPQGDGAAGVRESTATRARAYADRERHDTYHDNFIRHDILSINQQAMSRRVADGNDKTDIE